MSDEPVVPDKGEEIVRAVLREIENKPALAVGSALTACFYAVATDDELDQKTRDAITVSAFELARNVMHANGISDERLTLLLAERGVLVRRPHLGVTARQARSD